MQPSDPLGRNERESEQLTLPDEAEVDEGPLDEADAPEDSTGTETSADSPDPPFDAVEEEAGEEAAPAPETSATDEDTTASEPEEPKPEDPEPEDTEPDAEKELSESVWESEPSADPEPQLVPVAAASLGAVDDAEPVAELRWTSGIIVTAPAVVLTLLMTGVFYAFLLIEPSPRWLVLFGSAITALSMDGVLRAARREAFEVGGLDTTVFLFLPAFYALAVPVFLEYNVRGYWALPAAGLASIGFGALVIGQVSSVRTYDLGRPFGRYVAATATYFVAFALFSLMFTFDLHVRPATIATGLVAALLAAELLRDGEIDQLETLVFSAVAGLVIAQTRLAMHYLPIDGHLAALTLLLAFYFVTGLIHAHVTRRLDRSAALEYVTIAVTGLVLVVGAQAAGIA